MVIAPVTGNGHRVSRHTKPHANVMVPRLFTQDTGSDPVPGREGLFYSAGDPMSGRAGVRDGENCSRMERPPWMQRLAPLIRCRLAYRFGRRRRHDDPSVRPRVNRYRRLSRLSDA